MEVFIPTKMGMVKLEKQRDENVRFFEGRVKETVDTINKISFDPTEKDKLIKKVIKDTMINSNRLRYGVEY